jgi:hypothetical protein
VNLQVRPGCGPGSDAMKVTVEVAMGDLDEHPPTRSGTADELGSPMRDLGSGARAEKSTSSKTR